MDEQTLMQQICVTDVNTVFMRSAFPEYHTESVEHVAVVVAVRDKA